MTKVRIHAGAADELEQPVLWYEKESPNLGFKFTDAFENALQLLGEEHPPLVKVPGEAGNLGAKRLLLHRFPFSVVVYEHHDEFIVIALAHQSRRPGYWMDRFHIQRRPHALCKRWQFLRENASSRATQKQTPCVLSR